MEDKEFHDKVDRLFESKLKRHIIRIKDMKKGNILTEDDMNYSKVFFDSNLNIYKMVDGELLEVENKNFKALLL